MNGPQWVVTQIGSREHYAVPRAFHARGHLKQFYTDIWLGRGAGIVRRLPRMDALAHRYHPALPRQFVTGFNGFGLMRTCERMLPGRAKNRRDQYATYVEIGRQFARRVNSKLAKMEIDPSKSAAFLYTTGALETCEYLRKIGVPIIVDQIDPGRTEEQMVQEEIARWTGWQEFSEPIPDLYYDRLAEEWRLSDFVLVNSGWSRAALVAQGVEEKKIIVVPLCYEHRARAKRVREPGASGEPLTVLWLGQVILRKGIQYLFEAAAKLINLNIRFVVAGPVGISEKGVSAAPANVKMIGRVMPSEAQMEYAKADVFVLPTVSDGFALTQLEAMSHGLPVITTPNCGEVVTDGVDGFIVPARDSEALAEAIARLDKDRALLREMSQKALQTAKDPRYSLDGYADAVEAALARLHGLRAVQSGN